MIPLVLDIAHGRSVSTTHQTRPTVSDFEIMGVDLDMWEYSMSSEGIGHEYSKEYSIPKETALSVLTEACLHVLHSKVGCGWVFGWLPFGRRKYPHNDANTWASGNCDMICLIHKYKTIDLWIHTVGIHNRLQGFYLIWEDKTKHLQVSIQHLVEPKLTAK